MGAFLFGFSLTKYHNKGTMKRRTKKGGIVLKDSGRDDFWDLTRLVPKKQRPTLESFIPAPTTTDVCSEVDEKTVGDNKLHIARAQQKTETYNVADNLFLSDVTLETSTDGFSLYHRFMEDAKRYFTKNGEAVQYIRYFSYMPQYTQLTTAQLAYYLYWRSELLQGNPLPCDEGYLYLYAYECINLTEVCLTPGEALDRLLTLWQHYAQAFPKINKYFSEWVADLCLLYRLSPPRDKLSGLLPVIWKQASLPEFYFGAANDVTLQNTGLLLAMLCDYDYRASRCCTSVPAVQAEEFVRVIEHSMFGVFHELFADGTASLRAEEMKTVSHSAFCGALYAKEHKTKITIRYAPIAEAAEVRSIVSAAVKYSENLYRALHGNRNRLSVSALPECYRSILDAYYRVFFKAKEAERVTRMEPAYMGQYAPAETGVALSRADEIEALSWENTKRLVPEEEQVTAEAVDTCAVPTPEPPPEQVSEDAVSYLRCVVYGDREALAALARGADIYAEQINRAFLEDPAVGDIVLEPADNGYRLVEDYQSEVEEWIRNH